MSSTSHKTQAEVRTDELSNTGSDIVNADNAKLAELGYKSVFQREFSLLETVAFGISIMGVVASVTSTFSFGLFNGGHVGMVFGWLIPCCFVAFVALAMAEMASSMPYAFTPNLLIIANNDALERAPGFTISLQKWLLQVCTSGKLDYRLGQCNRAGYFSLRN